MTIKIENTKHIIIIQNMGEIVKLQLKVIKLSYLKASIANYKNINNLNI